MLPNSVVLKNVDAKSIHQQIMQLEVMQRDMVPDDSVEAGTVRKTLKLLHEIEEELRRQARVMHPH